MHAYIHTYIHAENQAIKTFVSSNITLIQMYIHALFIHACERWHQVHVYLYVSMYVYMYVCAYICM